MTWRGLLMRPHLTEKTLREARPVPWVMVGHLKRSKDEVSIELRVLEVATGNEMVAYFNSGKDPLFSPALGVAEDPATGSAAAAFAGFMATYAPHRHEQQWTISQGIEMGRPSTLHARVARRADGSTAVFVGGQAVRVSEGELWL
ncbi:MAG: PhzF family phenazine biosynthesis protein [Longimicrobiales bacterium]